MFHVVYLSFEESQEGRMYVGKHSSGDPYDFYFGSFFDRSFNPKGKIILEYCKTEQGAIEAEIRWQRVFKVVEDSQFANRAYQTSTKFIRDNRGESHPLYGVSRPDVRERNVNNNPAKDPEVRRKMSNSRKGNSNALGKLWWVNEAGEVFRGEKSPGQQWRRGRVWRG
jgi:hypothetical protein